MRPSTSCVSRRAACAAWASSRSRPRSACSVATSSSICRRAASCCARASASWPSRAASVAATSAADNVPCSWVARSRWLSRPRSWFSITSRRARSAPAADEACRSDWLKPSQFSCQPDIAASAAASSAAAACSVARACSRPGPISASAAWSSSASWRSRTRCRSASWMPCAIWSSSCRWRARISRAWSIACSVREMSAPTW